jgi:hypothetical protein
MFSPATEHPAGLELSITRVGNALGDLGNHHSRMNRTLNSVAVVP